MTPARPGGGDATAWLFSLQRFGIEPGLDRIRRLLAALGDPQRGLRVVLVGGTNGKGATAGALASMLGAAGERTGLFTSPHLVAPGERIRIAGRDAGDARFEALAASVRPHAQALGATFFETVTAMGILAFAEEACRTAVVEVGMGGRLDATNALSPAASIVTQVDLDHTDVLGASVEAIAREKAGILRRGRPAWTAARGGAREALLEAARREGADLRVLATTPEDDAGAAARVRTRSLGWDGIEAELALDSERLDLRSPLLGRHQGVNLALAALAARTLGVPERAVREGAAAFAWPGRLEPVTAGPGPFGRVRFLLDGAHNPAAAEALAAALGDLRVRPHLVFGASADKDAGAVLAALAPAVASVRPTRARTSPRAATPAALEAAARAAGAPVAGRHELPTEALGAAAAEAVRDGAPVLVAGSLYLLGEVRPWLLGERVPDRERWQ